MHCVQRREIGDDEIRLQELLVHRNVDDSRVHDVIGADTRRAGRLDCGLDQN